METLKRVLNTYVTELEFRKGVYPLQATTEARKQYDQMYLKLMQILNQEH